MIPILTKEDIKTITKELNEAEVKYVSSVAELIDAVNDATSASQLKQTASVDRDILYIAKNMSFANTFRVLHWAASNMSAHKTIDDLCDVINDYVDSIAENIQGIVGQFSMSQFSEICLPYGKAASPYQVLEALKDTVNDWYAMHQEPEFEGCRNITANYIEELNKYSYLLKICEKG